MDGLSFELGNFKYNRDISSFIIDLVSKYTPVDANGIERPSPNGVTVPPIPPWFYHFEPGIPEGGRDFITPTLCNRSLPYSLVIVLNHLNQRIH